MIHPAFLLFEGVAYLLFLACLIHAARRGLPFLGELVGGLLFGLLLEVVNVRMGAYHYGRFLVMLGEIPLGVGVGWAVIIYTAGHRSAGLVCYPANVGTIALKRA
jgi:hypothetical protein